MNSRSSPRPRRIDWDSLTFKQREYWLLGAMVLSQARRPGPELARALPRKWVENVISGILDGRDLNLTAEGAVMIDRFAGLLGIE